MRKALLFLLLLMLLLLETVVRHAILAPVVIQFEPPLHPSRLPAAPIERQADRERVL